MNDSSTGGYLAPTGGVPPAEDDDLDALIRDLIVGVTALPADAVQPFWPTTASKPAASDADGCAFGVQELKSDAGPAIQHDGSGDGQDRYVRHQNIDVLCSFFGPHAMGYAQRLADGLAVPQNREPLQRLDMAFIGAGPIRASPDVVTQRSERRYDMVVSLRRKIARIYPVLNLESAIVATTIDSSTPVTITSNIHS